MPNPGSAVQVYPFFLRTFSVHIFYRKYREWHNFIRFPWVHTADCFCKVGECSFTSMPILIRYVYHRRIAKNILLSSISKGLLQLLKFQSSFLSQS